MSPPLPELLSLPAGKTARLRLPVDPAVAPQACRCVVAGVPAAWVRTSSRGARVLVEFTPPRGSAPGMYPVSVTLAGVDCATRHATFRLSVEVLPALEHLVPWRELISSPRLLTAAAIVAVILWLGVSFWRGSNAPAAPAPGAIAAVESVAAPLLEPPRVLIGADWSEGFPTPTAGPTPTLRPTQTPLPPMPTPQPPPPTPAAPVRGVEQPVDGPYTYERMFREVGAQFGLDWRLLASIAESESSLNPVAVGRSGEQGIMQIMPETWRQFAAPVGESDPFDPYASARVSAYYLAYLQGYLYSQGYTESYWLLVAYNWGPNNLRQHLAAGGGIPRLRQNYAHAIIDRINDSADSLWTERVFVEVPR